MAISSNKGQKEYDSIIESSVTANQAARVVCNPDGSNVGGTVEIDEFPPAATITDDFPNPTTTNIMSMLMGWDGSAWDRMPGNATDGLTVNLGANNDVTFGSSPLQALGVDATGQDAYATILTSGAAATHIQVTLGGSNDAIISVDGGTTDGIYVPAGSIVTLDSVTIGATTAIQAKNASAGNDYSGLSITIW